MPSALRRLGYLLLLAVLIGAVAASNGQPPAKTDKAAKPAETPKDTSEKPATHKVEKGPFKIEVSLKGVFQAADTEEIALAPEVWSPSGGGGPLTVKKAVEHGTRVNKGEAILWLDLEKIDQAIKDQEHDRRMTELSIQQAELELPVLEKTTPIDLAAAERARRIADEDLKKYVEHDRALTEKMAHFYLKRARDYLDYEQEELRQLEKMYKSKDLTEETEEIILKRQRNWVEMAAFMFKLAEIERDETLKIDLPRRDVTMKENAVKAGLNLDRAKATLPLGVTQKRLALEKMKYDREKADDRLVKMKRDRELLTVKAPADGIVYHGKSTRGQWSTSMPLTKGAMVQADQVLMTVVKTRPIFVRAAVEEKDLHYLRSGMKGRTVPTPYPDLKLPARVEEVTPVPVTPGNFEAKAAVECGKDGEALVPGMACAIKLVPYRKEEALTVPSASVFTDDLDEDRHYVYVPVNGGKPEKKFVTIGKKADTKTEILQGLQEGDEILQEKPKPSKAGDLARKEDKK